MAGKKGAVSGKKKSVQKVERVNLTTKDKIKELEKEISTVKYNKKTQHAIGLMKAKLALLKEKEEKRSSVGKAKGDDRFAVKKSGNATAVLIGFPSVGKSTLLNKITNAKSDTGAYAFTTLSAVPGILEYNHAKIQIIDLPGIVKGAANGTGRGKEVLAILRNAELVLILIDALHIDHYKPILKEIYDSGVRIDQKKPQVKLTKKENGGISVASTVKLTKINTKTIQGILRQMRINNCDVLLREDISSDQLIDVIENNKKYLTSLKVLTKIDLVSKERLEEIKSIINPDVLISAEKNIGLEELKKALYDKIGFMRIYLKEVNKKPDLKEPLIVLKGLTIKDICQKLHKDFVTKFKFAKVWGPSAKFDGQVFRNQDHELSDKDILELHIS